MGRVWGIGKRRFKDDWRMSVYMFDVLVWAVLSYEVGKSVRVWRGYRRDS